MEKEKNNKSTLGEKDSKERTFNKDSFIGTFIIIIVTALATSLFSNLFQYISWTKQNSLEYEKEIRQERITVISDLIQHATKIEQLRDKVYWNKFFMELSALLDDLTDADERLKAEYDYRVQYEDATSEFDGLMYISKVLFEIEEEDFIAIDKKLHEEMPFNFDGERLRTLYQEMISEGKNSTEIIEKLEEEAESQYSTAFFEDTMGYVYYLQEKLK